ncbi:MAG: hypothetical protein KDL87_19460, partial [Verrucomicrobiae bacterium]|nr:hypothetical protein [Verrucomicrobiae bacterium]
MLGSFALLTGLLEGANFYGEERCHAHPRWRHWLAIVNTSLAVAVGWLGMRLTYPRGAESGEIDAFFLLFTILIGGFAGLRFWRKHSTSLVEAYFLKASGLLALFVVEYFDGPTRWLSLSVQTIILVWAWQRSRLKWIEVGYWVLAAVTLVLCWHDLLDRTTGDWAIFSIRHLVGAISLLLLSSSFALHARWSSEPVAAGLQKELDGMLANVAPLAALRFLGAIITGAAAVPLVA